MASVRRWRAAQAVAARGVGSVFALLIASPCLAGATDATDPAAEPARAPAGRELLLFDDVTVSAAAKRPQVQADAPSWVSIVTQEDIRRFGVRTLSEALQLVPGFYGTYDRNYDYLGVRGFQRPGDYNNRILLLVNGLTYNDDIYGAAPVGTDFGIDLEAIDHIEVVRGPGSALYGGNAIFAVVNVVTADAGKLPGARPLAEAGSYWSRRAQATLGHRFSNGIEAFTSGSYFATDGPGKLYFADFDSPDTHDGIAVDLDGEWAWNFYSSARWNKLFLQGGVNRREKDIPTASFGTVFDVPGTKTLDGRQFAELVYQDSPRSDLQLTGRAYYNGVVYQGRYVYADDDGGTYRNHDDASSHSFGSEIRGQWSLTDRNVLTLGAEYSYHPSVNQVSFDPGVPPLVDITRRFGNWGVYLENEFRWTEWATLVAGVRYDRYYDQLGEFSPRAGVILRPAAQTNVKLLYGRAFRPPSVYEQYYAYEGEGGQVPNPDLDSETINTFEIDVEQGLGKHAHGTLALYHYDLADLIDPVVVDEENDTTQFQNGPSANAYGLDLELRLRLPYQSLLRSSFSAQRVRSQGQRLSNSPTLLGKVELLFPIPLGPFPLEAGAELLVLSPRRTLAGNEVGTVNTLNLNLWYDTPVKNLSVTLGLYNLLDQRYADPAGVEFAQDRLVQNGLTFRTQVRYGF